MVIDPAVFPATASSWHTPEHFKAFLVEVISELLHLSKPVSFKCNEAFKDRQYLSAVDSRRVLETDHLGRVVAEFSVVDD